MKGIQYLRGIAACLVVFDHVSGMCKLPKYFGAAPFADSLSVGAVGVDLFFVISGFIIAYVSLCADTLLPRMNAATFLQRRFVRIVPFLWVCVAAYAVARILGRGVFEAGPYLRAATLYPIGTVLPNTVWTLRHEFLFYLVFTSCLALPRARFWPLALWLLASVLYGLGDAADGAATAGEPQQWLYFLLNRVNIEFGLGMAGGMLYLAHGSRLKISFSPLISVALIALLLAICLVLDYQRQVFVQVMLIGAICLAIVASAIGAYDLGQPRGEGLVAKLAGQLGDASYSIYLSHLIFVSGIIGFVSKRYPHLDLTAVLAIVSIATIAAGVGCHHLVERPVLRWSRRILDPRRALKPLAEQ